MPSPKELLEKLLDRRGLTTAKEKERFLHPQYPKDAHDPSLLLGGNRAAGRIVKAIQAGERIAVFSDYDTDGIPGAALAHDFFEEVGYDNFTIYIPHRYEEGYGLNKEAITQLADDNVSLIITIDCGMTDVEEVAHAKEKGLDVVITDHHLPHGTVPDADALVNPNQEKDTSPNKHLCGTAVAHKVFELTAQALEKELSDTYKHRALELVALATIADMVKLVGENRVLTHAGLQALRTSNRVGLKALYKEAGVKEKHLSEDDIGFVVAPRINAASRMDAPQEAFKLLVAKEEDEAKSRAKELSRLNNERKGHVAAMVKAINKRLERVEKMPPIIVMGDTHWLPGLLGLAATSIAKKYDRPVFLWGKEGSPDIKGSCRSDGSVDMVKLMQALPSDTFDEFGGHAASGGFSMQKEHVHTLSEKIVAAYEKVQETVDEQEEIDIDARLTLGDITWETYSAIEQLAPFGVGNPKPVFKIQDVTIVGIEHFGKQKNHLRLLLKNGTQSTLPAIGFFKTENDFSSKLTEGKTYTIIASIEKSVFRGRPELRLRLVDISPYLSN